MAYSFKKYKGRTPSPYNPGRARLPDSFRTYSDVVRAEPLENLLSRFPAPPPPKLRGDVNYLQFGKKKSKKSNKKSKRKSKKSKKTRKSTSKKSKRTKKSAGRRKF